MKGFIQIGLSTYQMMEVETEQMDALMNKGDGMHWPLRFDKKKRIYPAPPAGAEPFFYDAPKIV